ncbi:MAG: hypothetical protein HY314_05425 [Acidobacteria bacterium]|nr:hypothetical protein [Acidobacteriota bacterium]
MSTSFWAQPVMALDPKKAITQYVHDVWTTEHGLPQNSILSITQTRDGYLWLGTWQGLVRFDGVRFTVLNRGNTETLKSNYGWLLYGDREGNLWINNNGKLSRFKDGEFSHSTFSASSIYEDHDGNLWFGRRGELIRFRDGELTRYTTKDGLPGCTIWAIHEDHERSLWLGTDDGLIRFKDGKFTRYTTTQGLSGHGVRTICEGQDGSLWAGTTGGLNRLKDGKLTSYTTKDGLSHHAVISLHEDRQGTIWIGTEGGLNRFAEGRLTRTATKEGLPASQVTSIYEDQDGVLWVGTRGDGLFRLKDGQLTAYTTKEGLWDNVVTAVLEDGNGHLWMGSFKGIFRVSKKELQDVAEGRIEAVTSVVYGRADGMRGIECNSNQPSGWKSQDGRLWFPTIKGVVMVDPDHMKLNSLSPPVIIEQAIFNEKPVDLMQRPGLPPGKRELEFHYTALSFLDPNKVKFKYKLEGYDQDWVDAGTRRVAYYTNLSPDEYRFRVIACNNDGVWNETGAAVEFQLLPYFYEALWFHLLCALAFIVGGFVGYRKMQQRATEKARARAEAEQRSDYGQMVAEVAHEVRDPLLAIRIEAYNIGEKLDAQDKVRPQLEIIKLEAERLSDLMDDLLKYADPKPLQLALTDPAELLEEAIATYRVEHGDDFPKIVLTLRSNLPSIMADRSRLVQVLVNLIENAVKHAEGITTVTLSAEAAADKSVVQEMASQICLRVANDGTGIAPEVLPKIFDPFFTTGQGTGLGLAYVQRTIKRHGGTITVESQFESGTVFTICSPTVYARDPKRKKWMKFFSRMIHVFRGERRKKDDNERTNIDRG